MSEKEWCGDWFLLWELRQHGGRYPSRPAPGAKATPFDFEVPKDPWPEWLAGEYEVLKSPAYKSAAQSNTAAGEIGETA